MAEEKTNVMRVLDQKKIPYTPHSYPHNEGEAVDGATVASILGRDPGEVYKTLVTRGASKANYVFVVPVLSELDLKKAAKTVNDTVKAVADVVVPAADEAVKAAKPVVEEAVKAVNEAVKSTTKKPAAKKTAAAKKPAAKKTTKKTGK